MLEKGKFCDGCPLQHTGKGFVPDQVSEKAEFVLVGEAPGKNEVVEGKPFVGQAGHVLHNWLIRTVPTLRMAQEQGKVTLMNTLRCLPPELQGRPYPRGEEKDIAEKQCRQYDQMGSAHTVVLFGESPQRCWFGEELQNEDLTDRKLQHDVKGVMGRVGRVIEKDGKRWVFAPHPAFILRQPSIVEHGQQSLHIAAQTEKMANVSYEDWDQMMKELA